MNEKKICSMVDLSKVGGPCQSGIRWLKVSQDLQKKKYVFKNYVNILLILNININTFRKT